MQHQKDTSPTLRFWSIKIIPHNYDHYLFLTLKYTVLYTLIRLSPQMRFKRVIQLPGSLQQVHKLVCRINKGFCINNRQSSMSGEGLQCRSEAATCNQGRSERSQWELERCLPIPDVIHGCQALPQPLTAKMQEQN